MPINGLAPVARALRAQRLQDASSRRASRVIRERDEIFLRLRYTF